ncbi:hypothetical protein J6590_021153 [Homalodisca vitripennis]|nr:hypothetical protein J6590_021153 [Homalodisca vitripennis]
MDRGNKGGVAVWVATGERLRALDVASESSRCVWIHNTRSRTRSPKHLTSRALSGPFPPSLVSAGGNRGKERSSNLVAVNNDIGKAGRPSGLMLSRYGRSGAGKASVWHIR